MDAGDHLHGPAITMTETPAIDVFHNAGIGSAVIGQRNILPSVQYTGHAGGPEIFVFQVVVDKLLGILEKIQRLIYTCAGWRNQLRKRLRIVGGDIGVSQSRTQRHRMRLLGNTAILRNSQALFLKPYSTAGRQVLPNIIR